MNKSDIVFTILGILFFVVFFGGLILYSINKGTVDRFWTNFNKDKVTAKDEVYQTGSVRVYKFLDNETVCYVADKQGQSVGIFCK